MAIRTDYTNQRFGRLLLLSYSYSKKGQAWWLCQCDCGSKAVLSARSIVRGYTKSCGCLHKETARKLKFIDETGKVFGRLTVISREPNRNGRVYWKCVCSCGNSVSVSANALHSGDTQSCGCLQRERTSQVNFKHGEAPSRDKKSATKEYRAWRSMISRCYDQNNIGYDNYGGRGITVCEQWRHNYPQFLQDMKRAPEGFSLDRIDPNKGYSPENCRWASYQQQTINRRNFALKPCANEFCTSIEWKFCPYCGESLASTTQHIEHRLGASER